MAKKIGRPTMNPARNQFRIRLSDDDVEKLEECSFILGITKSDVVRKGINKVFLECKEKK